jgi:hypothetical protein
MDKTEHPYLTLLLLGRIGLLCAVIGAPIIVTAYIYEWRGARGKDDP